MTLEEIISKSNKLKKYFPAAFLLLVGAVSIFVPPVALACAGIALAVLSFKNYAYQREVLKGDNPNSAIAVGYDHLLMCATAFVSLMMLGAALGPAAPIIPAIWTGCIVLTVIAGLSAGGYAKLREDWGKSGVKPLRMIILGLDKAIYAFCQTIDSPIRSIAVGILSVLRIPLAIIDFSLRKLHGLSLKLYSKHNNNAVNEKIIRLLCVKPVFKIRTYINTIDNYLRSLVLSLSQQTLMGIFRGNLKKIDSSLESMQLSSLELKAKYNSRFFDRVSVLAVVSLVLARKAFEKIDRAASYLSEISLTAILRKNLKRIDDYVTKTLDNLKTTHKDHSTVAIGVKTRFMLAIRKFIKPVDDVVHFFSDNPSNIVKKVFVKLHHSLGEIYLFGQIAVFGAATVFMPPLGIAALACLGINYLRAQNKLPVYVSTKIEEFNSWIEFLSGIFIPNALMQMYTVYQIATATLVSFASPQIARFLLGKDAAFLNRESTAKNDNQSINKQENKSKITRDLDLEDFKALFDIMPTSHDEDNGNKNAQNNSFDQGVKKDLATLAEEMNGFFSKYPAFAKRKQNYENFVQLKQSAFILDRAKYYLGYIPQLMSWYSISLFYSSSAFRAFFDYKNFEKRNYHVNIYHVSNVPNMLPPDPENFTFGTFLENVEKKLKIGNVAQDYFEDSCLKSTKFNPGNERADLKLKYIESRKNLIKAQNLLKGIKQINQELASIDAELNSSEKTISEQKLAQLNGVKQEKLQQIEKLGDLANAEKDLASITEELEKLKQQLIEPWRKHFNLSSTASNAEVIAAYIMLRLKEMVEKIETGSDLGWDKTAKSLAVLQSQSKHVFNKCQKLLEGRDAPLAYGMLNNIVMVGGDFCAKGIFDGIFDVYKENMAEFNKEVKNLSLEDKIALNLQYYRKEIYEYLYNHVANHDLVKSFLFYIDFADRHDKGAIDNTLKALNLGDQGLHDSDLSTQSNDVLKELTSRFISYMVMRLITTCDNGYSSQGIINNFYQQLNNPVTNFNCPEDYNFMYLIQQWKNSFNNQNVQEYIDELLETYGVSQEQARNNQQKLCAMVLYDQGVLHLNNKDIQSKIDSLLSGAKKRDSLKDATSLDAIQEECLDNNEQEIEHVSDATKQLDEDDNRSVVTIADDLDTQEDSTEQPSKILEKRESLLFANGNNTHHSSFDNRNMNFTSPRSNL